MNNEPAPAVKVKKLTCGIIMPISSTPEYQPDHWRDVLNILNEAIAETEFEPKMVNEALDVGLIHDRIVTNIYNNEMVICDVSSKNPNVMFELGLRLAFDKPTIIVKDDKTGYSFDTGVIEHLQYPASLRYDEIVSFKEELRKKIEATYNKSKEKDFSPFLKSFGRTFNPANFKQTEITETQFILDEIKSLRWEMQASRMPVILGSNNQWDLGNGTFVANPLSFIPNSSLIYSPTGPIENTARSIQAVNKPTSFVVGGGVLGATKPKKEEDKDKDTPKT